MMVVSGKKKKGALVMPFIYAGKKRSNSIHLHALLFQSKETEKKREMKCERRSHSQKAKGDEEKGSHMNELREK